MVKIEGHPWYIPDAVGLHLYQVCGFHKDSDVVRFLISMSPNPKPNAYLLPMLVCADEPAPNSREKRSIVLLATSEKRSLRLLASNKEANYPGFSRHFHGTVKALQASMQATLDLVDGRFILTAYNFAVANPYKIYVHSKGKEYRVSNESWEVFVGDEINFWYDGEKTTVRIEEVCYDVGMLHTYDKAYLGKVYLYAALGSGLFVCCFVFMLVVFTMMVFELRRYDATKMAHLDL